MNILHGLDRLAHVTRLDGLTPYGRGQPRSLRWLPLPALIGLPVGYVLTILSSHGYIAGGSWRETVWLAAAAGALFWLSFLAANLIRMFGPRITWTAGMLDERELMLKAQAGSISYLMIAVLAIAACFYGGIASLFDMWMPSAVQDWVYLGFLLQGYTLLLPVWVASWLQPRSDEME